MFRKSVSYRCFPINKDESRGPVEFAREHARFNQLIPIKLMRSPFPVFARDEASSGVLLGSGKCCGALDKTILSY